MKRLLAFLLSVFSLPIAAGTFHATWNYTDFTTTAVGLKEIRIQTLAPYGVNGSAIIPGDFRTFQANASGSLTVSNLVNGRSYRVSFYGPNVVTTITNSFDTNVTGLVNAVDYIAAPITDSSLVAWSRAQADSRFLRTNISQYVVPGTNVVFVTNGNRITIHGTGGGGGNSIFANNASGFESDTPNPLFYNTNGGNLGIPGGLSVYAHTNVDGYIEFIQTNGVGDTEAQFAFATKANRLVIGNDNNIFGHTWEANFNRTNGQFTAPSFVGNGVGVTNIIGFTNALTIYVDLNGNDTNSGTMQSPVKTVTNGITKAGVGGRVQIGSGTFVSPPITTLYGQTIVGASDGTTRLLGTNQTFFGITNNVTVENLTIQLTNRTGALEYPVVSYSWATNVTFRDCTIIGLSDCFLFQTPSCVVEVNAFNCRLYSAYDAVNMNQAVTIDEFDPDLALPTNSVFRLYDCDVRCAYDGTPFVGYAGEIRSLLSLNGKIEVYGGRVRSIDSPTNGAAIRLKGPYGSLYVANANVTATSTNGQVAAITNDSTGSVVIAGPSVPRRTTGGRVQIVDEVLWGTNSLSAGGGMTNRATGPVVFHANSSGIGKNSFATDGSVALANSTINIDATGDTTYTGTADMHSWGSSATLKTLDDIDGVLHLKDWSAVQLDGAGMFIGNGAGLTNLPSSGSTNEFISGPTMVGNLTNAPGHHWFGGFDYTNHATFTGLNYTNGVLAFYSNNAVVISINAMTGTIISTNGGVANANSNTMILPGYIALTNASSLSIFRPGSVRLGGTTSSFTMLTNGFFATGRLAVRLADNSAYGAMDASQFEVFNGTSRTIAIFDTGTATFSFETTSGKLIWNADSGIARAAAGVLEINNSTAGAYRDLLDRSTIQSSLSNSPPVFPSIAGGGQIWSDGTNLCVTIKNHATGVLTTNKLTMSAWP